MAGQPGLTPQELVQAVQQLQIQVSEGQQGEAQVRAQLEALRQQQAQQATATANGLPPDVGAAFIALATSQRELVESLKTKDKREMSLIDNKGPAKPDRFTGKEERFLYWRTRLEAFVTSVFSAFEDVLPWCEECTQTITERDIENALGEIAPTQSHCKEIQEMNIQLFAVLQTLCQFTIVRSCGKNNGFEAWRRLTRRFDPSTGGRRRTMLRHILNPKCNKLEDLSNTVEQWEGQLRLYESRKRSDGIRHTLDNEIKIAVLEHLCPPELERHLQLTYQEVRSEVSLYLETRLGSRLRIGTAAQPDEAVPMDVGGFGKGGKKGDKGGKGKNKDYKGKGGKKGDKRKGKMTPNTKPKKD